jgi:hypothetical protein
MGFEICIYILRWVTKRIGKICDLPPAHPSSYFMTSPLLNIRPISDALSFIITFENYTWQTLFDNIKA